MSSDKDILTILRMALVVATKLDLNAFKEWVDKELKGYQDIDKLPAYRKVTATKSRKGDTPNIFNKSSKNTGLDNNLEEYRAYIDITLPIPHIVDMVNKNYELHYIELPDNMKILYEWRTKNIDIKNIIEQVKTKILEWILILEKNGITGSDISFTKEEKEIAKTNPQIINYGMIIYGDITDSQLQQGSNDSTQTKISQPEDDEQP